MENYSLRNLAPTDAFTLGVIRAGVCGFILSQILLTSFADLGQLPATLLRPTGAMKLLPWRLYDLLLTSGGIITLKYLMVLALGAATIGYLTSWSTKLSALLFLFYEGFLRSYGHFNHDEMPAVYILIVLAFVPCGHAFSLDHLRRRSPSLRSGILYGYPILLMRILLAWSYFSSALIKFRVAGLSYLSPDNLSALAIEHSLDNLHDTQYRLAFSIPQASKYSPIFVGFVLAWEFLFPLAIFFKRIRFIILPIGIGFHLATIFLMNIFFPYHVAMYVVFVDWGKVMGKFKLWNRNRTSGQSALQGETGRSPRSTLEV